MNLEIPFDNSLKETFKGSKVLITGNTGFKGSWLSAWLSKLGANCKGFSDLIPTNPSHYELIKDSLEIDQVWGDIADFSHLQKVVETFQPNFIFHLAAQPLVRKSYQDPLSTFRVNTIGMLNVLESIRLSKNPIIGVLITSDKSYKNIEQIWGYKENDVIGGNDPYSGSKGSAELIVNSYFKSFFKNSDEKRISVARAGNVIGGGDWSPDRIIPDAIKSWSNKKQLVIRSPNATRPWQHVLEPLSGYLRLAIELKNSKDNSGEAFNFGPQPDQNFTVSELLNSLSNMWDYSEWLDDSKSQNTFSEAGLLKLNCEKAAKILKWRAVLDFNEIISMTSSWYKNYFDVSNLKKKEIANFTFGQIDKYTKIYEERRIK